MIPRLDIQRRKLDVFVANRAVGQTKRPLDELARKNPLTRLHSRGPGRPGPPIEAFTGEPIFITQPRRDHEYRLLIEFADWVLSPVPSPSFLCPGLMRESRSRFLAMCQCPDNCVEDFIHPEGLDDLIDDALLFFVRHAAPDGSAIIGKP